MMAPPFRRNRLTPGYDEICRRCGEVTKRPSCSGNFLVSGDVCELSLPSMLRGWMMGLIFLRIRKAVALKKEFAYPVL